MSNSGTNWGAIGVIVGAVGIVVALGAWLLPVGFAQNDAEISDQQPETPPPVTETEDSQPVPSNLAEGPPAFVPVTLTLNDASQVESCSPSGNTGYSWHEQIVSIGGVNYPTAFVCAMSFERPTLGYIDFLVPAGATAFTTVAGQADDSENTSGVVRFEVIDALKNEVLSTQDLGIGQSAPLDIPIANVVRVRLQATLVSYDLSPWDYSLQPAFGAAAFR